MPDQKRENFFLTLLLLVIFLAADCGYAQNPQAMEYLRKAQFFFKSSNFSMARDFMQRAKNISPDNKEILDFAAMLQKEIDDRVAKLRQRGQFFLDAKNVPEAEKLFNEVLELSANDEYAISKLAEITQVYEKIEDFKNQGIEITTGSGRAHDVDLYSAISFLNRARGLFANGDRVKSLELVEEVLKREPNYKPALELKEKIAHVNQLEAFIAKAETAFLEGRMRETVDSLNTLIIQSPERYEYYLMRARANLFLKNFYDAEKDLWQYFNANPDRNTVFPLLSDAFFGQGNFLYALGFSRDPVTGADYKNFSYRLRCHYKDYPFHYLLLLLFAALFPVTAYYTWQQYDKLSARFPLGALRLAIKCAFTIAVKSPLDCLGDLIIVSRDLNVAWLNYLTGLCLLKIGQIEGAQRFLSYSLTNDAIKTRAYYFTGLTRKLLNQRLQETDFEEAVLTGLGKSTQGWHPRFIKQIEQEILISYSKEKSLETFEGMAYKLVNDQTGVLS